MSGLLQMRPSLPLQSDPDHQCQSRRDPGIVRQLRRMRQSMSGGSQENTLRSLPRPAPDPVRSESLRLGCPQLCRLLQRHFHRQTRRSLETSRIHRRQRNCARRAAGQFPDSRTAPESRTRRLFLQCLSRLRGLHPQILSAVDRKHPSRGLARDGSLQTAETDVRK